MEEGRKKFEEWIQFETKYPEWSISFSAHMRKPDPDGLGMFTRFICGICEKEEELQGIRAFALIYQEVGKAYAALKADHQQLDAEWARIGVIARAMYDLESGIGLPLQHLVPELSQEETQRRLALLDQGRARFGQILKEAFTKTLLYADRNLLIAWASKVYYHVHGFQAPPRFDAALATRDAMGQTDHFRELLDDVLAQCPEAKSK